MVNSSVILLKLKVSPHPVKIIPSTAIKSDAFEELAELVQTLEGEISILEVLFDSSSSNWL